MFIRTIVALRAVDLGFRPRGVLTMSLDPQVDPSDASPDHARFRQAVLERIERLPGVRSASVSIFSPLSGRDRGRMVHVTGFEPHSELERVAAVNPVSPGFFRTFGIEVVAGRTFDERDRTMPARVAIVNEAAVRRYFGGRSPLGELMMLGGLRPRRDGQGPEDRYQVVGVVRDAKHMNIRRDTPPFVFLPIPAAGDAGGTRITLAIAADLPAEALSRVVAEEVRRVHGQTLVSDVVLAGDQVDATLLTERLLAAIATTCAALALGLAAIGLFGSLSYAVARRRVEIGLRMALGAAPAQVVRGMIRDVLPPLAGGLALGLVAGWATARLAEAQLFGVAPGDPATYLGAAALLAAVAVLAAWQPAWRAASVDPADVLRRG
jgi:predicted permease